MPVGSPPELHLDSHVFNPRSVILNLKGGPQDHSRLNIRFQDAQGVEMTDTIPNASCTRNPIKALQLFPMPPILQVLLPL